MEKIASSLIKKHKINDSFYIVSMNKLNEKIKKNLNWFFSNYKNESNEKWSKVHGFIDKENANKLYNSSIIIN